MLVYPYIAKYVWRVAIKNKNYRRHEKYLKKVLHTPIIERPIIKQFYFCGDESHRHSTKKDAIACVLNRYDLDFAFLENYAETKLGIELVYSRIMESKSIMDINAMIRKGLIGKGCDPSWDRSNDCYYSLGFSSLERRTYFNVVRYAYGMHTDDDRPSFVDKWGLSDMINFPNNAGTIVQLRKNVSYFGRILGDYEECTDKRYDEQVSLLKRICNSVDFKDRNKIFIDMLDKKHKHKSRILKISR